MLGGHLRMVADGSTRGNKVRAPSPPAVTSGIQRADPGPSPGTAKSVKVCRTRRDGGERLREKERRDTSRPEASPGLLPGRRVALTVIEEFQEFSYRRVGADDGQGPYVLGVSSMAASSASTVLS